MRLSRIAQYEFPSASSIIKYVENFGKITAFSKSFCPCFSKSLYIYFNHSQNVSPVLRINSSVMAANEGSMGCKCFKKGNLRRYSL